MRPNSAIMKKNKLIQPSSREDNMKDAKRKKDTPHPPVIVLQA